MLKRLSHIALLAGLTAVLIQPAFAEQQDVPSLTEWGLIVLGALLVSVAIFLMTRTSKDSLLTKPQQHRAS